MANRKIADFVLGQTANIPEKSLEWAATLLLDTIGVAAGAASLDVAGIARDYACVAFGAGTGTPARIMFDGRKVSAAGAGFAAATQIDNLDGHDGYNPTKGHIGCAVVPALFAFAEAGRTSRAVRRSKPWSSAMRLPRALQFRCTPASVTITRQAHGTGWGLPPWAAA